MKAQIEVYIIGLLDAVENGDTEATIAYKGLYAISKLLIGATNQLKPLVVDELDSWQGKRDFEDISISKTIKSTYSYSHIENISKLKTEQSRLMKLAQSATKNNKTEIIDEATGEIIPCAKVQITDVVKITRL